LSGESLAIAAAVVGGASLFGGRGTIGGCFIGAMPATARTFSASARSGRW